VCVTHTQYLPLADSARNGKGFLLAALSLSTLLLSPKGHLLCACSRGCPSSNDMHTETGNWELLECESKVLGRQSSFSKLQKLDLASCLRPFLVLRPFLLHLSDLSTEQI